MNPGQVFTIIIQLQRFIRDNDLECHLYHWNEQSKNASEANKNDCVNEKSNTTATRDKDGNEDILAVTSPTNRKRKSDFSGMLIWLLVPVHNVLFLREPYCRKLPTHVILF